MKVQCDPLSRLLQDPIPTRVPRRDASSWLKRTQTGLFLMGPKEDAVSSLRHPIVDGFEAISKCTFQADGTRVCTDSTGRTQETRREEATLPDGTREVTYLRGSKVDNREVTRFDEKGNAVSSRNYDNSGRLTSENSTPPNGDDEWKIYDENGHIVQNCQTRESNDKTRFDRWSYDSEGLLVWHLALNSDGELLSYWYKVGYKPMVSSSGSLGICRRTLCVDYKFDEQGSGRMEKTGPTHFRRG